MDMITGIFTAFGLSASAGLNAYIPLLGVALLARYTNLLKLNPPWDILQSGWIIGLLIFLSLIEFFADKAPAVNHINDVLQTVVRPVAGAIVFAASASVITEINPILSFGAGILVAGSVHAVKSIGVRPAVTATTGGMGNVPVSILEDVMATGMTIAAIIIPVLLFIMMLIFAIWALTRTTKKKRRKNHKQTYQDSILK